MKRASAAGKFGNVCDVTCVGGYDPAESDLKRFFYEGFKSFHMKMFLKGLFKKLRKFFFSTNRFDKIFEKLLARMFFLLFSFYYLPLKTTNLTFFLSNPSHFFTTNSFLLIPHWRIIDVSFLFVDEVDIFSFFISISSFFFRKKTHKLIKAVN